MVEDKQNSACLVELDKETLLPLFPIWHSRETVPGKVDICSVQNKA